MIRGLIKRTESEVERSLDIRSLIKLRNTVKIMTKVLFSDHQVAMLKNQRRSVFVDLNDSSNDEKSSDSESS